VQLAKDLGNVREASRRLGVSRRTLRYWLNAEDINEKRRENYPARQEANRDYCRRWRETNRDRIREYNGNREPARRYYAKNAEKLLEKNKKWRTENRRRLAVYRVKRRKKNLSARISDALRNRLRDAVKREACGGSAVRDLGCTAKELKRHLESQFRPGMTWENWGRSGWHIDHIKPLVSFDLADPEQVREACHYTNLQPLWASENMSKGRKPH
jgi:DNA-binding transcriptional MerR regulator